MRLKKLLLANLVALAPLTAQAAFTQQELNDFATNTKLEFEVLDNFVHGSGAHDGRIILTNNSKQALPKGESDWEIYVHAIRLLKGEDNGIKVEHIKGDLHKVSSTKDFAGLKPGETVELNYKGSVWAVSNSDFMPRAFIAEGKLKPAIFANTDTEDFSSYVRPIVSEKQQLRYGPNKDNFPVHNAQLRFDSNQSAQQFELSAKEASRRIIPTPTDVDYSSGTATIDSSWQIRFAGRLKSETAYLVSALEGHGLKGLDVKADHEKANKKNVIKLKVSQKVANGQAESYQLEVEDDQITIVATDNKGAFYGIQSLLALLPTDLSAPVTLSQVEVEDTPRYDWRGMHYDMGRNFHGKDNLLKLIEQMARYKLNKLHLHLTEDEGWRLQIPGLEELTDIGGKRCFDPSERSCLLTQLGAGPHGDAAGNGYLTTDDFVEVLKYAKARHIEVIPEVDMPGHARAAIISMEARYDRLIKAGDKAGAEAYLLSDPKDTSEYLTVQNYDDNSVNVCMDSAYNFIDKVAYELQVMYRAAGTDLAKLHLGGDEVGHGSWTGSPECQKLFLEAANGVSGVQDLKAYFMSRASGVLAARGLAMGGWEDGLMYSRTAVFDRDTLKPKQVWSNPWDNIWEWGVADRAYRLANSGYDVVLASATHLYFDHPYEAHPESRGYYWAARYTDTQKVFGYMPDDLYANADFTREGNKIENLEALVGRELPQLEAPERILGMQGHVWSETIRTPEQLQEMIYPRLLALAERAWYKAGWEGKKPKTKARDQQWAEFASVLAKKELQRMSNLGVTYNLPVPGGKVTNGKLEANVAFPGLAIEYSTDGSDWKRYSKPTAVSGKVWLRSRSESGVLSRATEVIN